MNPVEWSDEDRALLLEMEQRAVRLLAMREHGEKELAQKLSQKFPLTENRPGLVDFVILTCRENGWLSEARFVESYVRQAKEKGQGPYKIRQALNQKTRDSDLIEAQLAEDDRDWAERAREALIKKYGDAQKPTQMKEQAKRMRFLQSRGFSQSQIYKAFQ